MTAARHPAVYICVTPKSGAGALAIRQHAIAEATRQRGWPAPSVYADEDDPSIGGGCSPAMATLAAAIGATATTLPARPGAGRCSGCTRLPRVREPGQEPTLSEARSFSRAGSNPAVRL